MVQNTPHSSSISRIVRMAFHQWHIKVLSVIVAVAIVYYYYYEIGALKLQVISVPLEVRVGDMVMPVDVLPQIVEVNIRSEDQNISAITSRDIRAILDLTEFERAGQYRTAIRVERMGIAKTINLVEVTPEPNRLTVEMDVITMKEIAIELLTVGVSPRGYAIEQAAVFPPMVVLSGPQKILDDIDTVGTTEIDISQLTQSTVMEVDLELPHDYVMLTDDTLVTAELEIAELIITNIFEDVAIAPINIGNRWSTDADAYRGTVTLQGTQSAFALLPDDASLLFVDGATIAASGSYTLAVTAELPKEIGGLTIQSYAPTAIDVEVTQRNTEVGN